MSSAPEVFPFGNPSEPAFETALRGYEKKQVERYVAAGGGGGRGPRWPNVRSSTASSASSINIFNSFSTS